uniref:FTH domain-containing protein n=1 Tax=Panagrellus redivivus TaxID=6233 RepID=A0A7E4ZZS2_PANRE
MSNNIVLKRFTYDWLIRFAELHPFQLYDYHDDEAGPIPQGAYNPLDSKYAKISPLFTTLINRYMPYIYQTRELFVEEGIIQEDKLPSNNKTKVYACECLELGDIVPGSISSLQAKRVTFFYSGQLSFYHSHSIQCIYTADELKYLLKSCPFGKVFFGIGIFDKPTMFSEIWPLLKKFTKICLDIENLNYGENVATVLRENQVFPDMLILQKLNVSDKAVLDIIDYNLSLPESIKEFRLRFLEPKPLPFYDTIVAKFASAGYQIGQCSKPETKFTGMEMMVRDNTIDFQSSSEGIYHIM